MDFLMKSSFVIIPASCPLSVTNKCEMFKNVKRNCTFNTGKFLSTVMADLSADKVLSSKSKGLFNMTVSSAASKNINFHLIIPLYYLLSLNMVSNLQLLSSSKFLFNLSLCLSLIVMYSFLNLYLI